MKRIWAVALLAAWAATQLLTAVPAAASSGSFSNAFATPDWKYARFSVSGVSTPCGVGYCSYFPIVTAVPSLPEYSSCREVALDSDPNTQAAWTGSSYSANTSFSAEVPKALILSGVYGQRLCLSLIGTREINDVVCEAQKKTFEEFYGEVLPPCPRIKRTFEEAVTSVLLSIEPPAPPAAATPPAEVQTPPRSQRKKCPKGKRKITRNGKTKCVRKHRRAHR